MPQLKSRLGVAGAPADADLGLIERSSVAAAVVVTPDARIVGANAAMRQILGLVDEAWRGSARLTDFFVDDDAWAAWRSAEPGPREIEVVLRSPQAGERSLRGDVWATGEGIERRIVAVLVDASDRQALRAAARHSARMEALGSLTAGVAHDFNNLLTVLVGNLYLLGEELREKPRAFAKLKAARDAGKRGSDLIKQLLGFARREAVTVGVIDPARVVEEVVPLLRRALGSRITLDTSVPDGACAVRASAAQLESAVVNLAVNARDAIEGKGRVAIEVRAADVGSAEAALRGLARPGRYVAVSVRDTGSGIAPEALGRVFEPFFSTKAERGGTGLGLSMVRWFAEQAGGAAAIESVVGAGTTVTLWLPHDAEPIHESNDKTMPLSTLPGGNERVVVLAHDEALRATIRQTLEVLGYSVRLATGAEDMLAAVAAEPTDLLVLDGVGRADADVLARARAALPGLRMIATAADSTRGGQEGMAIVGVATLAKPFTLAELAGTVRRALDSPVAEMR